MPEPRKVAWGYVTRYSGDERQVLVAERYKEDDTKRSGQLVIPGGGIAKEELAQGFRGYELAAIREANEETGITAFYYREGAEILRALKKLPPQEWNRDFIHGSRRAGIFHLRYTDSGKEYEGMMFPLTPVDEMQEPDINHVSGDTRNPGYLAWKKAVERAEEFTPACQILTLSPRSPLPKGGG